MPWLSWLVTSLSPRMARFSIRSFRIEFLVDKVALGQSFFFNTSVSRCQCHSTDASYSHVIYLLLALYNVGN